MLAIMGAFAVPYLIALCAFPLLVKRGTARWVVLLASCLLVEMSPLLMPANEALLRLAAAISATIVAVKLVDVWLDAKLRSAPTLAEAAAFLANPFTHVRRCLPFEPRPSRRENASRLLSGSLGCAVGIAGLVHLSGRHWLESPFIVEHVCKVMAFMLAVVSGLTALAALWRLLGGTARDFMERPFSAHTPAEFWRRYNRNMQQFFWRNVFAIAGGRRAPVRTTLLVFVLSALMHELIFAIAVGRVQGYQTAYFALQGVAAALTARVDAAGWKRSLWIAATLVFMLLSSVLFFASIHAVVPFYSRGLPAWLWAAE